MLKKRKPRQRCAYIKDEVSDTSDDDDTCGEAEVGYTAPESLHYLRRKVQVELPRTPIGQRETRADITRNFEAVQQTREQLMEGYSGSDTDSDPRGSDSYGGSFIDDDTIDDLLDYEDSDPPPSPLPGMSDYESD